MYNVLPERMVLYEFSVAGWFYNDKEVIVDHKPPDIAIVSFREVFSWLIVATRTVYCISLYWNALPARN